MESRSSRRVYLDRVRVKRLLDEAGLKVSDLASQAGYSANSVSQALGRWGPPVSRKLAGAVADALRVPVEDVIEP
jgi:hypothetical protein